MFRLAYRHFVLSPWRTILTTAAIASVVAVILVLEGFEQGLLSQSRQLVLERQADLIVIQKGVSNMHAARSILPQFTRQEAEAVEGVSAAHPLTGITTIYEQEGKRTPIYLLVHDAVGGPRRFVSGGPVEQDRDIVIDRSIAARYSLEPGDAFILSDFEFHVSGVTSGNSALLTPVGFISYDGLLDFYFESDLADDISTFPLLSFLLIQIEPGIDRDTVIERLAIQLADGDVLTPEQLAENDAALVKAMMGAVFNLLISIAYLIGIMVTAIIMFAAVLARRRSIGVLRALGFSTAFLSASIMLESTAMVLMAIPLGMGLATGIAITIETAMPLYTVLPLESAAVLRTSAAALGFAIMGGLAPLYLIHQTEPALAFRS